MLNTSYTFLRTTILSLFLIGCSEDLENMTIFERSIHQPDRFSDDKSRDKNRKPLGILELTNVKSGMKVIDLLGGGGYYTELFNYIVGDTGKVYIQNTTLFLRFSKEELEKRLTNNRLKNVIRLDSDFADMKLPKDADVMFIGLSYHDIYVKRDAKFLTTTREEFFPQIFSAIKPGGKLVITDHAAKDGTGTSLTTKLHRIDEEWAIKDIESAGFKLVTSSDLLRNPKDDRSLDIWKKQFYHKTDRFVHVYEKPKN